MSSLLTRPNAVKRSRHRPRRARLTRPEPPLHQVAQLIAWVVAFMHGWSPIPGRFLASAESHHRPKALPASQPRATFHTRVASTAATRRTTQSHPRRCLGVVVGVLSGALETSSGRGMGTGAFMVATRRNSPTTFNKNFRISGFISSGGSRESQPYLRNIQACAHCAHGLPRVNSSKVFRLPSC
jgi:hypothetical protein